MTSGLWELVLKGIWVTVQLLFLSALLATGVTLYSAAWFGIAGQYLYPGNAWLLEHGAGLASIMASCGAYLFVEQSLARPGRDRIFSRMMKTLAALCLVTAIGFAAGVINHKYLVLIVGTLGIMPMLLGLPGDNTHANYAEANRAFYRQTVIPLVRRTADALAHWLEPAFGPARLEPDLDAIEALAPEREKREREPERGDPHVRDRVAGRVAVTAHQLDDLRCKRDDDGRDRDPEAEREPERLRAEPIRDPPLARPGGAPHLRRRPVLEEVEEAEEPREDRCRDRERRQLRPAEMTDDRRVDEDVERLRGERTEGGEGETEDLAVVLGAEEGHRAINRIPLPFPARRLQTCQKP